MRVSSRTRGIRWRHRPPRVRGRAGTPRASGSSDRRLGHMAIRVAQRRTRPRATPTPSRSSICSPSCGTSCTPPLASVWRPRARRPWVESRRRWRIRRYPPCRCQPTALVDASKPADPPRAGVAAGSVAEQRRQIVGGVVAEQIAPAPVHGDARPVAGRGHPAVAGDHGRDPGFLRAEPALAHEDATGRLDGTENAGVEDAGVIRCIPPVDAAVAPCPRARGGRPRSVAAPGPERAVSGGTQRALSVDVHTT